MKNIEPTNYIQIDQDFISVMIFEDKDKDNRYVIDTLLYLLNELSHAISKNSELDNYTVTLTQKEASHIITFDPVNKRKKNVNKVLELKEIIFRKLNTTVSITENNRDIKVFMFNAFQYIREDKYILISFNPTFIEYFKKCRYATEGYFKLYLDIMISLPYMNNKIMYSLCNRYDDQIKKHKSTNATTVDLLKFYFDDKKEFKEEYKSYDKEYSKYEYSMNNYHLQTVVDNSIEKINEHIDRKNAINKTNFPGYEIEWIDRINSISDKRRGELDAFILRHKQLTDYTPKKEDKSKNTSKTKSKNKPEYNQYAEKDWQ